MFGTDRVTEHMCLVFTRCYAERPNDPNRQVLRTRYRAAVTEFLEVVSGRELTREIPVFCIDAKEPEGNAGSETSQEMVQFHGWVCGMDPLPTRNVRPVDPDGCKELVEETNVRLEGYEYKTVVNTADEQVTERYKVVVDRQR
jgi:hypothetical protein